MGDLQQQEIPSSVADTEAMAPVLSATVWSADELSC